MGMLSAALKCITSVGMFLSADKASRDGYRCLKKEKNRDNVDECAEDSEALLPNVSGLAWKLICGHEKTIVILLSWFFNQNWLMESWGIWCCILVKKKYRVMFFPSVVPVINRHPVSCMS